MVVAPFVTLCLFFLKINASWMDYLTNHYLKPAEVSSLISNSKDIKPIADELKVALVTAGELRSFYFNRRSWERYVIGKYSKNLFIFASVLLPPPGHTCPFLDRSLNYLYNISTEIEVSYSTASSVAGTSYQHSEELYWRMCFLEKGEDPSRLFHGNAFDMNTRKMRAATLAFAYAKHHEFEWDLMVFARLDSAFYSPPLNYKGMHNALHEYISSTHRPALLVPESCGFSGFCDRFAVGLPSAMHVYFHLKQSTSLHWMKHTHHDLLTWIRNRTDWQPVWCDSEVILAGWLLMHNVSHMDVANEVSFITLRPKCAPFYCNSSREVVNFNNPCLFYTDTATAVIDQSSPFTEDDFIFNATFRCGSDEWIESESHSAICEANLACGCDQSVKTKMRRRRRVMSKGWGEIPIERLR
jgi:hypothetical protein